ncbi:hypothetical protein ASZ90_005648 [hydrocarbon metagenome]|uniref:Uncharacterized protein n=1 Tax=hydrocarbon metagenome TaxID=938273 RepID=A0A0W8FUE6_9ZZZZ
MDKYKILICYSGGKTFIGYAEKSEENIIILHNPRILTHWRKEDGEHVLLLDFVNGFPEEINFFHFDSVWVPSKSVANWYMEETSELSIYQSFPNNELRN